MVKNMCLKAGLEARANHSLRATALFKANVQEKVIQEQTDHRSIDALRLCKRSDEVQHSASSRIFALGKDVEYHKAVCPVHEKASKETVSTTGLPITLNMQSITGPLIYPMAIHRRPSKSILWHYRSSQKWGQRNFQRLLAFPVIAISINVILGPILYIKYVHADVVYPSRALCLRRRYAFGIMRQAFGVRLWDLESPFSHMLPWQQDLCKQ